MTKKAARPDEARAANHLLRLALEGRICLYLRPPFYKELSEKWRNHRDVKEVVKIQALEGNVHDDFEDNQEDDDEEEDDSDESDDKVSFQTNKFSLLADE